MTAGSELGQASVREDFNCFDLVYFFFFLFFLSKRTLKLQRERLESQSRAWCERLSLLLFFFPMTKLPLSLCHVGPLLSPCPCQLERVTDVARTEKQDTSRCGTLVFASVTLPLPSPVSPRGTGTGHVQRGCLQGPSTGARCQPTLVLWPRHSQG